eukprot:3557290-Heterocapsa_arctica.AAC.1
MKRIRGDKRFHDIIGDGDFSEIGLYTQYIPSFRKLLAEKGVVFEPMDETLVELQALCLPLGTSYDMQRLEHSGIQSKKRAKTECINEIYQRFIH